MSGNSRPGDSVSRFSPTPVRRRSRDAVAASCRRHRAIGGALDVAIDAGTTVGLSQRRLRLPVPMTGSGPPGRLGRRYRPRRPSEGRPRADAEEAGQRLPPDHLIVQPAIEWRRGSQGFKIRVSVTALLTSLFSDFGALPSSISYSELYSALQTHCRGGPGESDGAGVDRQAVGGAEILRAVEPLLERLSGRRQPPGAGESADRPARNRQRQF